MVVSINVTTPRRASTSTPADRQSTPEPAPGTTNWKSSRPLAALTALLEALGTVDGALPMPVTTVRANVEHCEQAAVLPLASARNVMPTTKGCARACCRSPSPCPRMPMPWHGMVSPLADASRAGARPGEMAEPVFGIIKAVMGFRQFLAARVESVRGEWNLFCCLNLKRLHTLSARPPLKQALRPKPVQHTPLIVFMPSPPGRSYSPKCRD